MCVTGTARGSDSMRSGCVETKDDAVMTGLRGLSVGKGGGSIGSARTQDIVGQIGGLGSGTEGANVAPATQGGGSGAKRMTLETALLEVEARFLLNLPEEELASVDRLFFQMEQAHWYYEDFLADKYDSLPHFPLEGFTRELFQHSELLKHLKERHEDMVRDFHSYKYQVPVYGCVLLNSAKNKFVLVCNWEGTAWGLPRGKVNEGEDPMDCAVRETLEECGYDATGRLREEDSFTIVQNAKRITLYVVKDVPEDFPFQPRVRKEVSQVRFFGFDSMPTTSYNVQSCLAHLRRWLSKGGKGKRGSGGGLQLRIPSASPQKGGAGGKGRGSSPSKAHTPRVGKGDKNKRTGSTGRSRSAPVQHDVNDANNMTTFGAESIHWDVDAMFHANEKLTGRQFTYDGNPQRFGEYDSRGALIPKKGKGKGKTITIATLSSSGSIEVKGEVEPKHGGMAATATGTTEEEKGAVGKGPIGKAGASEGVDHLELFQFDAQDILAALDF